MRPRVLATLLVVLGACQAEEGSNDSFVAMQQDWATFRSWTSRELPKGALEHGQEGGRIYYSHELPVWVEHWPTGSLILKETLSADGYVEIHAMARRNGGFNPEGQGWEWFGLLPSLTGEPIIEWRGPAPPEGAYASIGSEQDTASIPEDCNSCHQNAHDLVHLWPLP